MRIAVLLAVYNRKVKTIRCLESLFQQNIPAEVKLTVYLVDDGSRDGTRDTIAELFPLVKIITGTGNLYWAGGMRLAWGEAIKSKYDGYLLINDDTILYPNCIELLLEVDSYVINSFLRQGVYIGSTISSNGNVVTYGGSKLIGMFSDKSKRIVPDGVNFFNCELGNANIMYVSSSVVNILGILSDKYTHGIADYDYTLSAVKKKIPVMLAREICGECEHDHGSNWLSGETFLKERIQYLKSPKGLAYYEYLSYLRVHFPFYFPIAFLKLWMKTLFPFIWDKWKKNNFQTR